MRYFRRHTITNDQVLRLKKSLKLYADKKIINYNDNYIEVTEMEKGVLIKDRDNELLQMIEKYLSPYTDPWNLMLMQLEKNEWLEYDYNKLPSKLKSYMYKMDALFFNQSYKSATRDVGASEYDRREEQLKKILDDYTQEEYEKYVLMGHPMPTPLYKKARDSARRTYKAVNAIIKSNMHRFDQFITLTVASHARQKRHMELNNKRKEGEYEIRFEYIDGKDFEGVKGKFTRVMDNLRRRLKKRGIPLDYIAVWEVQSNGSYHFHLLCSGIPDDELFVNPEWLDINHKTKERYNGYGLKVWTYGKSDVQEIKSRSRLTTYVSKYIMKSFMNVSPENYEEYMNKKKYFVTKGMDKPTINYGDCDIKELDEIEPYEREYVNPYNGGQIKTQIYTLTGLDNERQKQ